MADHGVKVSLPGKDISSTDPRDFVFNSKYGTVKVFSEPPNKEYKTITVNAGSSATISIEHGLPFIPLVMWFSEIGGHWYLGADRNLDPGDPTTVTSLTDTYVNGTYIKVKYTNTGGSNVDVNYYYFIFADNG